MKKYFSLIVALAMMISSFQAFAAEQESEIPGAAPGYVPNEADLPQGLYKRQGYDKAKNFEKLLAGQFTTTVFTFQDIIIFSYFDNTEINVYNNAGVLIDNFVLAKDEYKATAPGQGVFVVEGNKSYSVLIGDAVTNHVMGYFAVNENGYPLSTKLNTYMPSRFSDDHFFVYAYEPNTQYEVINLATGVTISAGILNEGEFWQYEQNSVFLGIRSNKPVSALSYNDQGYYVPAASGSFIGMKFYGFAGDVGNWPNGINITGYEDNIDVVVTNMADNSVIWSGPLNEGECHAITITTDTHYKVEASGKVTVSNTPYAGYSCCYAYLTRHIDAGGFGIGTLFYVPTISGRFDVFSFDDNNTVNIYNSQGNVIWNGVLQSGEGYSFQSGKDVYKVESTGNLSVVTSNSGTAGADFMPLNYATTLPDLQITSLDISFDPAEPSEGDPVVLAAQVNNPSQIGVQNVQVQFYDGDPEMNGIPIGDPLMIPSIPAGESRTVEINWTTPKYPETHFINVLVDPNNGITESNESNNQAEKPLRENEDLQPPLSVQINAPFTQDLDQNDNPIPNPFTVTATIFNNGTVPAENVTAEMLQLPAGLELDPNGPPALQNIGNIQGQQSKQASWQLISNQQQTGFLLYQMKFDADNADQKDVSRAINVPDATPPANPLNLTVQSAVNGNVTLSWDANNESDLFGYNLYYDSDMPGAPYDGMDANEGGSPINVGNLTTYTVTGLDVNKTYYFALTAFDTRPQTPNESGYSNEVMAQFTTQCEQVTNIIPEDGTSHQKTNPMTMMFEWSQMGGSDHYQLQVADNSNFQNPMLDVTQPGHTYNMDGSNMSENQTYWWRVRSHNGEEYCPWSVPFSFDVVPEGSEPLEVHVQDVSICTGTDVKVGNDNLVTGGSGNHAVAWHPSHQLDDGSIYNPTYQNPFFDQLFTVTVIDAVTGERVQKQVQVTVGDAPSVSTQGVLKRIPPNTSLDLNTIVNISGGTPPYTPRFYQMPADQLIQDPTNFTPTSFLTKIEIDVIDDAGCVGPKNGVRKVYFILWDFSKENMDVVAGRNETGFAAVYPNPVKDVLNLEAAFVEVTFAEAEIYDLLGNKMVGFDLGNGDSFSRTFNVKGLTPGMYVLKISTHNDVIVNKFIVE